MQQFPLVPTWGPSLSSDVHERLGCPGFFLLCYSCYRENPTLFNILLFFPLSVPETVILRINRKNKAPYTWVGLCWSLLAQWGICLPIPPWAGGWSVCVRSANTERTQPVSSMGGRMCSIYIQLPFNPIYQMIGDPNPSVLAGRIRCQQVSKDTCTLTPATS